MYKRTNRRVARILVADDFAEWRARARLILQARPEWQVISEACDGLQAVQRTSELHPDIVLLDLRMPILNGIEAAQRILQACPTSAVIFVTQDNDEDIRAAALAIGAAGYLLKANAMRHLVPAIEAALRDDSFSYAPMTESGKYRS
jgi:two-component system nitrate/nitrite response regulator NarL